jgi:NADPH:quinone reductase
LRDLGGLRRASRLVIDRKFALSEAAAAHAYVEGRSAFGRVVMLPRGV